MSLLSISTKSLVQQISCGWIGTALCLLTASSALGQGTDSLIGIWTADQGSQIVEILFRSDGRYQLDTKSTDPVLDFASTERGRYEVERQALVLTPYDFFGEPQSNRYGFEIAGTALTLTAVDTGQSEVYHFKTGSREDVLAREKAGLGLVGAWGRVIPFAGKAEYTFRPGGYYFLTTTSEDSQFPPEVIRGRYEQNSSRLLMEPHGGVEAGYEIDVFGTTLTLIKADEFSAESTSYEKIPGSDAEVQAKAAEAEAFLKRPDWQVGTWEIRDGVNTVDLTLRPDGHYVAKNDTELLRGIVRGRYTLESGRIHLFPFVGQGLYSRDNGDFGKVERIRELDYYDGELQFIDQEAMSFSVTLARKRDGSEAAVMEKARQAQIERAQDGWHIGVWEVNDPSGWMEFTLRPDNRYIAKAGTAGVPGQVERGQYRVAGGKLTLAPYAGLGEARGFELDLYDGDLFLVGDLSRMVIARKVPGSEAEVIEKTLHPEALRGERGSILGLWTANLPGESVELVFRPDGEFRLSRCGNNALSHDYGLYTVDMATRTLVSDSRFVEVQTQGLDFYGNAMTIYGGLQPPSTYTVNLGSVDADIAASLAADAEEDKVDAQWLARVPVGPRDPNAVQVPIGDIPADPNPGRIINAPTVLSQYRLYRRLIPGFAYFNVQGTIKSVPVVNTREWHFFSTGRVLVRFKNYRAGVFYPNTVADVTTSWGAYRVEPKPSQRDIYHHYADNVVFTEMDLGEQAELTLEDGRRNLFWRKDYQILSEWAAEQKPIPCQPPGNADPSLMNVPVSLATNIKPDDLGGSRPVLFHLTGPVSGNLTMTGSTEAAGNLVIEHAASLASPVVWQSLQTNSVPGGPFRFLVPHGTNAMAYFRVRTQ